MADAPSRRRGGQRSPAPKGSIQGGTMGVLRALVSDWPGEPFIASADQKEIARLLHEAGYTKCEMTEGNLSKMLKRPDLPFKWQQRVCEVLRLETIGLDVKVLKDDEETSYNKVKHQLRNECASIFESNRNSVGLILLRRIQQL